MSKKKPLWFKRIRGSYLPISWQGWLLYIPFVSYLVLSVVVTLHRSRAIGYVLFSVFVEWVAGAVVLSWIASLRSRQN
ncbi:MAG TPA: hypothetical protein VMR18_02060 [Candidatus Saccharimonadales bacterium]|nr:hypothetical protein [Candidatus Saccharimonadales bacterium]